MQTLIRRFNSAAMAAKGARHRFDGLACVVRAAIVGPVFAALLLAACGGGDADLASGAGESPQGVPVPGDLFVSPTGDDADPGTLASPKRSIAGAAALLAGTGRTVWLLGGTYGVWNQGSSAASVPSGVNLQAYGPLQPLLRIRLDLQGDSTLHALSFRNRRPAITASSGTQILTNLRFSETADQQTIAGAIDIDGSADTRLSAARSIGFAFVEPGMRKLARVQGSAKLSIGGGTIVGVRGPGVWENGWPEDGVVVVKEAGRLAISGTKFGNVVGTIPPRWAIGADGNPRIALKGVTIDGSKSPDDPTSGIHLQGSGSTHLDVVSSVLQDNAYGIHVTGNPGAQSSVRLAHSKVGGGTYVGIGVIADVAAKLRIVASEFGYVQLEALRLSSSVMTDLAIEQSAFTDVRGPVVGHEPHNPTAPVAFYGPLKFRMRDSSVTGPGGLELAATSQGQLDLGSMLDPGGNTIVTSLDSNGDADCGLKIRKNPFVNSQVLAVGNTWRPLTQGSNANGAYAASGPGAVWDVAGPVTCLPKDNFQVPAGVTLRLDQNPA